MYRSFELVSGIVGAAGEFYCLFRLLIIRNIITLTEHVVSRGVDHRGEFLRELLARAVFFFILLTKLPKDRVDLIVVLLQVGYLHLILVDYLCVLFGHGLDLGFVD